MKNRKTRIAIIVEVKKREMPFMSILREVLMYKGYEVKLVPFRSLCTWRLISFRPDIVLINGLRHENPYFIKQVFIPKKLFKSKVACYYSEQVGYYNLSIAKSYYNKVIFDNVDYHIAWGPRFTNDLKEMGVPKEKLWYLGSLQYDIDKYLIKTPDNIKKELSDRYNIQFEKKWVLYADNIIENYQPADLYKIRRRDTFEMVERVATINPDCQIIFRHHPDTPESEKEYARNRFADINNVSVISEGHIFDWTCSISALIMWVSTSSLQTMFMGKPVFGFMTSDGKEPERYWYKDIFPTYNDAEKLATALYETLEGQHNIVNAKIIENQKKYISDWYFKKDGLSFERFCWLMDIVKNNQFNSLQPGLGYNTTKYISILYFELQAWVGDIVKNRRKDRNILNRDIQSELEKYDISRFENIQFVVKESESGKYLSIL